MATRNRKSGNGGGGNWDAIIIGSGMGGMTAGAALARAGHRVLLLEQYHTIGGLTHSFSRNGFRWDVGIHYLSSFAPGDRMADLLNWLCDSPIPLEPIGAVYDVLHIGDAEPLELSRPFEAQAMDLKERFPEEHDAIDAWFEAVHEAREEMYTIFKSRAMPRAVGEAMEWWHRRAFKKWCARTTAEVADEITDNEDLKGALFAQWGVHGGQPSKASFAAHALIANSFLESGAWYPVGGANAIAEHMLPTITKAGGEVRTSVRVEGLVMDGDRVIGVETADGETIYANAVVSDIGARETVDQLLPERLRGDAWVNEIRALPSSICHFSLFMGFEGDIEAAGASRANHWLFPNGETDAVWTDAPDSAPPMLFVSFASLKDPEHDPGPKQHHSGEIMVLADWSTVERWGDLPREERGEDYAEFKRAAKQTILKHFRHYLPELADLLVYAELSTPLSTVSVTGHHQGAFYGLDVTPERMRCDALRMKTPVDGLFLGGQDAASPGVPGALWGGLLSAACVDPKVYRHISR